MRAGRCKLHVDVMRLKLLQYVKVKHGFGTFVSLGQLKEHAERFFDALVVAAAAQLEHARLPGIADVDRLGIGCF